ncbi:hypothetical protein NEMIN01_1285 [Nematocida minor]|uniref:uncharacterized protein n=1 Tax=Nematocida minor TaxID=1912983 RepID=UPI00221FF8D0|nr:uncharacterized protein NEMIN01_1285 [Nematocida minor]KAI5190952.1 hypothetical protein NEMIN01_1285 [Nematocida minor]
MHSKEELFSISGSKDVRFVVGEIQKKGESFLYNQGTISVGIEIFYKIVYSLYMRGNVQGFDSLSCLLVGLLDIAEKVAGSSRQISKIIAEAHIAEGYPLNNEGVRKIVANEKIIMQFTHAEHSLYREASSQSLLQTEVIICSLIEFNFFFLDLHEILWAALTNKRYSSRVRSIAWIVLTDALSYPFLEHFSSEIIIKTVEKIALKIAEKTSTNCIIIDNEQQDVLKLEEEIISIYVNNCRSSEFIQNKESKTDRDTEDAFEIQEHGHQNKK